MAKRWRRLERSYAPAMTLVMVLISPKPRRCWIDRLLHLD
jgi:hypothetical protein